MKIDLTFGTMRLKFDGVRWWIKYADGEGMEIGVAELEALLLKYLEDNF